MVFLFATVLMPGACYAQSNTAPKDSVAYNRFYSPPDTTRHGFFSAKKFNSSFHVQFEGDLTYLFQQPAALTGFKLAWVVNHKLSIGARFDIISTLVKVNKYINTVDTITNSNSTLTPNPIHPLNMSATFNVGYIFRADKKVSIEPDLGIGWSYVSFNDPKVGWIDTAEAKQINFIQNYFIVNPSLSVIWNCTKHFRVGAVAGAQGVFGTDYLRFKTYRIRGVYAGLFLRFGTF